MPAETERRHRRSRKGNKPTKTTAEEPRQAGPTTWHDIPNDVVALVLLRLDSTVTLLRAAATCKPWRRTITGARFLSRFRALHAPFVAGHYHATDRDWLEYGESPSRTGDPVFVPSSSSATVVDSRRFSLDFLPKSDNGWAIADSRGSLLLLMKKTTTRTSWNSLYHFSDLLVCDPLTRRKQGILPPADTPYCLGAFLLDGDRRVDASNFRVLAVLNDYQLEMEEPEDNLHRPAACVFSPGSDGGWRVLPRKPADSDGVGLGVSLTVMSFAGRVNSSLYWVTREDGATVMLALDEATMAFSRITFPADDSGGVGGGGSCDKWSFRVISGEDGRLRVVRMIDSTLKIFTRREEGSDDDEWVVEKLLRLPEIIGQLPVPGREDYWWFQRNAMIVAAHETYVLVTPWERTCLFSVELETMEVELQHERNRFPGAAYPCEMPWPPALEACAGAAHHGSRRGRRR